MLIPPDWNPESPLLRQAPLLALLLLALNGCASTEPWPEAIVAIQQLKAIEPMRISVRYPADEGLPQGSLLMRVHVDTEGKVVRASLLESSGNGRLDQAALTAVYVSRFVPFVEDGKAVAVTAVGPMHFRK